MMFILSKLVIVCQQWVLKNVPPCFLGAGQDALGKMASYCSVTTHHMTKQQFNLLGDKSF